VHKFIMQTLLIATRNAHKTREIAQVLGSGWEIRDLTMLPGFSEVEETGSTFEENATLKALAISKETQGPILADDSGLEVDALNGAPGVYSARFAGPDADDKANRELLKKKLESLESRSSPARFRCVMVLAREGEMLGSFSGVVEGKVINDERGEGGFGYDSMFIPFGYNQTFAELAPEIKNSISHRARALSKVIEFLMN
jgi:XTP/dITP diphosphohydrolase